MCRFKFMKLQKIITPGERISKKIKKAYVEIILNKNKTRWVPASQSIIGIEKIIIYEGTREYEGEAQIRFDGRRSKKGDRQMERQTEIKSQIEALERAAHDFRELNIDYILMVVASSECYATTAQYPFAPYQTGFRAESSIYATPIILRE